MTFEERLAGLGVDLSDFNCNVGRCAALYEKYYEQAKAMADEYGKKNEFVAALITSMLLCEIAERDDIIDRMETLLVNVTGEMDWMKKCMQQFQFHLAECIEGGTAKGHEFRKGDIYPVLGGNNGVQICYENKDSDADVLMCHTWDYEAPVCCDEDEKFIYQDGTIPPLFDSVSRNFKGVPEDWSVDNE